VAKSSVKALINKELKNLNLKQIMELDDDLENELDEIEQDEFLTHEENKTAKAGKKQPERVKS
jgi:hypothetical protein